MTTTALAQLRALIAADPAMQVRLARLVMPAEFADAAADEALAAGIAIDADAIYLACQSGAWGIDQYSGAAPNSATWPSLGWLPVAMVQAGAELAIDWAHFADERLTLPFFEESLRTNTPRPLNRLMKVRTPLDRLASAMPPDQARAPDGLIFHMSRCGSTLVSQMIAAMPTSVVVSEAPPLDTVVQLAESSPEAPIDARIGMLRAMASALGRDRFDGSGPFVIKLDCWHSLALPLFRAAFPDTPWIFLFRDPVEVMVSHERMHGSQTVQGMMRPGLFGFDDSQPMPPMEFSARALASVCAAAVEHAGIGGGMFVDYAELPHAVESRILPHFKIVPDAAALSAIRAAAKRDAKARGTSFTADSTDKQAEAHADLRAVSDKYFATLYKRLQALAESPARLERPADRP